MNLDRAFDRAEIDIERIYIEANVNDEYARRFHTVCGEFAKALHKYIPKSTYDDGVICIPGLDDSEVQAEIELRVSELMDRMNF